MRNKTKNNKANRKIRKKIRVQLGNFFWIVLAVLLFAISGCATNYPSTSSQSSAPVENDPLYNGIAPITFDSVLTKDDNADFQLLGDKAARAGQQDKAIYAYLRAIQKGADKTLLFGKIGDIHRAQGNRSLALMAYQKALEETPNDARALLNSGLIYLELRDYSRADSALKRVVELDRSRVGSYGTATVGENSTQTESGEMEGITANKLSAGDRERTVAYDQSSPYQAYIGLGILADLSGDYQQAVYYYQIADAIHPRSAVIYNNLGYSHYLAGDFTVAEQYFRKALQLNPDFERAWRNLALAFTREQRFEEAFSVLSQVMDKPRAYNTLGYLCMLQGNYNQAEVFFQEAITLSPSYYELAFQNLEKNRLLKRNVLAD